ncbi:MAG TPA: amidohydrolase family protein, partial [Polyangiaceae bacterium]|nr:amidohydrolase family protein [Polyangiaceae bacterium]
MTPAALRSTRVVCADGVRPALVSLAGEQIDAVLDYHADLPNVRDVGDWVIAPGLVDCHVHINEPGRTEWEGFESATRAAAAGGVTTVIDMPLNCLPVTTSRAAFETKLAACAGQCFVDVGFWGGV